MAKERFTIQFEDGKFVLYDSGFVYSRYATRDDAENDAAVIVAGEKADVLAAARELDNLLDDSPLAKSVSGSELQEAIGRFIQQHQ